MHDLLLAHQDALRHADLIGYAEQLGLDVDRFSRRPEPSTRARRASPPDVDSADLSGVSGTPTFFVNGRRHHGAYDIETLSAAVRAAGAQAVSDGDIGLHGGSFRTGPGTGPRTRLPRGQRAVSRVVSVLGVVASGSGEPRDERASPATRRHVNATTTGNTGPLGQTPRDRVRDPALHRHARVLRLVLGLQDAGGDEAAHRRGPRRRRRPRDLDPDQPGQRLRDPVRGGEDVREDGKAPPVTGWTGLWLFPFGVLIIPAIVWFVKVQRGLERLLGRRRGSAAAVGTFPVARAA